MAPYIHEARINGTKLIIDITDVFVSRPFLKFLVDEIVERHGLSPCQLEFMAEGDAPVSQIAVDIANAELAEMCHQDVRAGMRNGMGQLH